MIHVQTVLKSSYAMQTKGCYTNFGDKNRTVVKLCQLKSELKNCRAKRFLTDTCTAKIRKVWPLKGNTSNAMKTTKSQNRAAALTARTYNGNYAKWRTSIFGAIILHGPHHVAKQSTTTNLAPAEASWDLKAVWKHTICYTTYQSSKLQLVQTIHFICRLNTLVLMCKLDVALY